MKIELNTKSMRGIYEATATYVDGVVTVHKGSRIDSRINPNFKPPALVAKMRADRKLVDSNGVLLNDVAFNSLSTAATFVAGRISNGMMTWKTEDGRYVRYTLKAETKE